MNYGRISQILLTQKEKNAGVNSVLTYAMNTVGCVGRAFTLFYEVDDILPLLQVLTGVVTNAIILFQTIVYKIAPAKATDPKVVETKVTKKVDPNGNTVSQKQEVKDKKVKRD